MSNIDNNVQFEEDTAGSEFHIRSREVLRRKTTPTSIRYLVENGIVKTEAQAITILISTVVIFLVLTGWIVNASLSNPANLYVTDQNGRQIPFETYVENIRNGDDPLQYKS